MDEAWDRALDAAEAVAAMAGKPVVITADLEGTAEAAAESPAPADAAATDRTEPAAG